MPGGGSSRWPRPRAEAAGAPGAGGCGEREAGAPGAGAALVLAACSASFRFSSWACFFQSLSICNDGCSSAMGLSSGDELSAPPILLQVVFLSSLDSRSSSDRISIMSTETQELIRLCEQLPEAKRIEVADFVRFLLAQEDEERWEQIIASPTPRP